MTNPCRLFATEYSRNYARKKLKPSEIILPRDRFAERIEEGEIDPRMASIPAKLDQDAEQLILKHFLDSQQTVYQVTYKNPWLPRDGKKIGKEEKETKERGFENELLMYIHDLYFDPHDEKILAPPVTTKRMLGYIRPKLLHGSLTMYQDTFGRTGARIMLEEHDKKNATVSMDTETSKSNNTESKLKKIDPCNFQND